MSRDNATRTIKAEDVQIGTKRTMTGKYSARFLYEGEVIYRLKQSFKTREESVAHAQRVLEMAPVIALNV